MSYMKLVCGAGKVVDSWSNWLALASSEPSYRCIDLLFTAALPYTNKWIYEKEKTLDGQGLINYSLPI